MSGLLYGLDKELAEREASKRDGELEEKARAYLEEVSGLPVGEDLLESLHDGTILCHAMNAVAPGSIKKINTSSMPFKQMENIANFLKACRSVLKMHEHDLFTTADLYDGKSIVNVTNGIVAFSRAATKYGFKGPTIAPKEAQSKPHKQWESNPNAAVSKLNMGSSTTMQKTGVDMSGNVTFGADNSKTYWGSSEVSKLSQGSSKTMERPSISKYGVTFGHDASSSK